MKKIFYIIFFYTVLPLTADWSPYFLDRSISLSDIQKSDYIELQNKIIKILENSWCSKEKTMLLMDLVVLEKPQVCVEIGAFTGSSILPVAAALKYNKSGEIYAIDAWSNREATFGMTNDEAKAWWSQLNMTAVRDAYYHNIKHYKVESFCKTLHAPSNVAVNSLPSIDFLHIDGNYSCETSYEDVQLYLPKVKIGGYILFTNLHWIVEGKITRMKAFSRLLDFCEILAFIDDRSTYLLRKLKE